MPDALAEALRLSPDERERVDRVVEILSRARQRQPERIDERLTLADLRRVQAQRAKTIARYNLSQTAKLLGVTRQAAYYWINKGWVRPKRDGRGYPVFTVVDIQRLMRWRNALMAPPDSSNLPGATSCTNHLLHSI